MSREASRYTANIHLQTVNDSHALAIGRVPAGSRVLDLGVADGSVAAVLTRMGCRVWGVDLDEAAAQEARMFCEKVVVGDLNRLSLVEAFDGTEFDVVLMLDVLEHLADPVPVLRGVTEVLARGGWGVISLPNVAHISARLEHLAGRFVYRDAGLLDRTHLRFFDRDGVDELLVDAGWSAIEVARVTRPLGSTEIQIDSPDPDLVRRIESEPDALTYQFVVMAAPSGSPLHEEPPLLPAAVAQAVVLDREAQIVGLRNELERLSMQVVPDLVAQLAEMRAESEARLRELTGTLAVIDGELGRLERR